MSKSVFVSHATKDTPLITSLVDLIEDGIGVPEGEIFCSSLPGYGIPAGKNFVGYMRDQMDAPRVVVLVLTQNYFQSHFCLSELGAAWVKGHNIFPILVPPLTYSDVKDVLLGTQVIRVDDDVAYNQLREALEGYQLASKSGTKWDTKRKLFLQKLPDLIASLPIPTAIDPAEHAAALSKLSEAQVELLNYEAEADKLKRYISQLENAKDATEVATLKAELSDTDPVLDFNNATAAVGKMRSKVGGTEVLKAMIADHYGHQYAIDLINYGDEYQEAALKQLVNLETRQVLWNATRARELAKHLAAIDAMLDDPDTHAAISQEFVSNDVPLEPDNLEFWQEFYGV